MITIKELKDPKLNVLECGYADLFSVYKRWNFDQLTAPYWRLWWNKKPGALIIYGSRRIKLEPSSMVLLAPHTMVSTRNYGHIGHLFLHFQVMIPLSNLKPHIFTIPVDTRLQNLAGDIIKMLSQQPFPVWNLSFFTRVLIELTLARVNKNLFNFPVFDARIQAAIAYLEERLKEPISNAMLAKQADMNVNAFVHLFKKQVGHSPYNFLLLKRIEKACILLHFSDTPIKQIAEATGFYDRYHFSRIFKRQHGMGPAEFRLKNYSLFTRNTNEQWPSVSDKY